MLATLIYNKDPSERQPSFVLVRTANADGGRDVISMFKAKALKTADAHVAYPLVACRYPSVTLPRWVEYVRLADNGDVAERLVCLVDARDRHHAIFSYRVMEPQTAKPRMRVAHIATFQLIGDAIHRALHGTLDALAQENRCREVIIEPWTAIEARSYVARPYVGAIGASSVLTIDAALAPTGTLN